MNSEDYKWLDTRFEALGTKIDSNNQNVAVLSERMKSHSEMPHHRPCGELVEHIQAHKSVTRLLFERVIIAVIGGLGGLLVWLLAHLNFGVK